jgi:hypothetical protein
VYKYHRQEPESLNFAKRQCKLSMLPVCLIGVEAGCREQRRSGNCSCRWRYVPACQLDHPGGCDRRRIGKRCNCGHMWMPECLSPGCPKRRRGKLCDCPRWPGDPCIHITSYANRMRMLAAALTLEKGAPPVIVHGARLPNRSWIDSPAA